MVAGACSTATPPGPGSPERAAATVAQHRRSCPEGTTLKQSRHDNERLKVLVCLDRQGRQQGEALMFDAQGRREILVSYRDGRMHGATTQWHVNGQVFLRGQYVDGLEDGRWEAFTAEGKSLGAYTMTSGSGERTRWHRNGKRKQRLTLVEGVPEGAATEWHPNGEVALRVAFRRGKIHGALRRFHMNGSRQEEATFIEGLVDGAQRSWTAAGVLESVRRWKRGKLHGKSVLYARSGVFKTAACFVDDRMVWDVDAMRWVGDGADKAAVNPKAAALEKKALERACP